MPSRIEDYALIGDCHTAALVGRDGSIDWLCLPRFDSPACFASLLGGPEHGRWLLRPSEEVRQISRRYRGDTLVLETEFRTDSGTVAVIDLMPPRGEAPDVVRVVEGRRGRVPLRMELVIRCDYGSIIPWVRRNNHSLTAVAGPDMLRLDAGVEVFGRDMTSVAEFDVAEGQSIPFVLTWNPSHQSPPASVDGLAEIATTERWWREWSDRCTYVGPDRDAVLRSLITLKALTYAPTGGIVAAPTASLPERIGGARNWDYRYCWLRDATFTLLALLGAGYTDEARAWREWLLRAAAGEPSKLQIVYGLAGERRLDEHSLRWLPGYEGSKPVRIGNAAWKQHQLDVYGEVVDAMYHARRAGIEPQQADFRLERAILDYLESDWRRPDHGIWEVRGRKRHFTHSKVMAWVAFDRAIKAVEQFRLGEDALERWKHLRRKIHDEVCTKGFNPTLNSFVQSYGSADLDASLLMIAVVGFLPADDPRMAGTVAAIEQSLKVGPFLRRYHPQSETNGLPPGEGMFLPCSFWLAGVYDLMGRRDEARDLFDQLLCIGNDVGLLSEEYDVSARRFLGNFPQALSHIGLVDTALNLSGGDRCPAEARRA